MLSVNPRPPHQGREKGGKGRETYKFDIKTALLIILLVRENTAKCIKPILSFLDWSRWELDLGMNGSESGSGSLAGQGAVSSSEGSHG